MSSGVNLTQKQFEDLVGEAVDSLPEHFAQYLVNVFVTVEDEPSERDFDEVGRGGDLLGIYRGIPITARSGAPTFPDAIVIFRGPTNRVARSRQEAVEQIRETVIHEVGHLFGLGDDELP